ncbi:MAG: A/G-specific adenine glycosylase, partial [Actinomycetota bacterium]|nr:A/G-specific adenine glycosylase [Actinomycetota bacterium]
PGEVIEAWQGLGYNRRAVRLHACARVIVADHGGRVPDDLIELTGLPGVGSYTARAVLAFAFEQSVGVVDTNAARVLARAFAGRRLAAREVQVLADSVVPAGRAWIWNSAMLDLGATICTARQPACGNCPLAEPGLCRWHDGGRGDADPASGTAGASGPQSRFGGSDRQGRGRLVAALIAGPVGRGAVAEAAGWPEDPVRAALVAATLVDDGLAAMDGAGRLCLP